MKNNNSSNDCQVVTCPQCFGLGYIQQSYKVIYTWNGAKYWIDTIVCPKCHGCKTIDY
jgi:hypothetical protein